MITSKVLMATIENNIEVANGTITAKCLHMVHLYERKDGDVDVDVELMDIVDVVYMGMPIGGTRDEYKKFISHFNEMGIDMDSMLDEACVGVVSNEEIEALKKQFLSIV